YGAALKTAQVSKGATVAVFGLGGVGLSVVQGCRTAGAARIIAVDLNPSKFDLAKKMGATEFLNPSDVPAGVSLQQHIVQSRMAVLITLLSALLVTGRTWKGSAFGGYKGRTELPGLVDDYLNKKLDIDSFVTHTLKLEEINRGFDLMHSGESIRSVVLF
ncbi:S-glutathione dehydrogenase, partial [Obelidium mucronatum]